MSPEFTQEYTKRPVNPGAEEMMGKEFSVLDHGFIYLVDYMGSDSEIARAARTSYGKGTKTIREDADLIKHLLSHDHTSPFEMVEFKFHAKMPIFVARQWIRHRTASLNEMSARYSILDKEFYVPSVEEMGVQSKVNNQGRVNEFNQDQAEYIRQLLINDAQRNYEHYEYMLNDKGDKTPKDPSRDMLARELARMNLSLNFYTQWYWKIDLHNLLHFLNLRMDPHAQREIQLYAFEMAKIVKESVPITWKSFEEYKLNSLKLSRNEVKILDIINSGNPITVSKEQIKELLNTHDMKTKWEEEEFKTKLNSLGYKING